MAKGRVYHWKHGWIPLDAHARAILASRGSHRLDAGDIKPPAKALERAKARQAAWKHLQESRGEAKTANGVTTQRIGGYNVTKVDGYPEVAFKEVVDFGTRPPEQYREVAKVVQDALKPYPRALTDQYGDHRPLVMSFTPEMKGSSVMADTQSSEPHKIRLNIDMWDKPGETMATVADMKTHHWGVFAEATDLESFRRAVITHEIGHVLQGLDEDENKWNGEFTASGLSKGKIDKFADEAVTPKDFGFTKATPGQSVDQATPRWQVDNLNGQSAYALTNKYEYFAEAFLDGTINGDRASQSGKRAVSLVGEIFGPGSPTPKKGM